MNDLPFTVRQLTGPEITHGYAAMHELRGHRPPLATAEPFVAWVPCHPEGYRLAGAFLEGETDAAAVIGFRPMTLLYAGRTLYVDDLSTRQRTGAGGWEGRCSPGPQKKRGGRAARNCTWIPGFSASWAEQRP